MSPRFLVDGGWIGSKLATSPLLALLIVFNFTFTGFLVPSRSQVLGFETHFYDLWSSSLSALAILLVARFLKTFALQPKASSIAAWMLGSALGIALQGVVVLISRPPAVFEDYLQLVPSGFVSVVAACYGYTLLLAGLLEGTSRTRKLRATRKELLQARATLDQEVDEVSRSLAAPVEAQLGNFLAELRSAVVTGANGKHIATSIFEFVDKQLRPGAAALAVDVEGEQTRVKSVTLGSMKFDSSIRKLSFGQSLSPLGAALLLASFYVPAYLLIYDLASASAAFVSLALAGVSCLLLGRLFRTSAHWTIWALFNGAIFGTCFFVSLPLAALTGGALEIDLVLPTALVSSVVVFALSSLESLLVRRAKLQTALQDLIAQLESTLRALETRLSVIRTKVSRQLHNDTQGKLVAVALRAGAVPTLDHAAAESILEELGQIDVRTSISMRDVKNFASRLAELRDFWSGALEIEWSASTEATKLLDLDSVLADRCVAILAEVLTNAAKYSSDGTVAVNLTESDGRLVLRASNPTSTAFGDSSPTGLGEASMREFTKSLSVTLVGGVFKLEAVL